MKARTAMGRRSQDTLMRQAQDAYDAGNQQQAWTICEQLLRQDANHAEALIVQGRIALTRRHLELAAGNMLKAAALRPNDPQPHVFLATIRTYQGRYDEAVARCDMVLRRHPDHPPAIAAKADAYEKSGQPDKAHAALRDEP